LDYSLKAFYWKTAGTGQHFFWKLAESAARRESPTVAKMEKWTQTQKPLAFPSTGSI